jgi:peptidoglycan/xylan/chitin deacetylase (PgdA/CDA1 family)
MKKKLKLACASIIGLMVIVPIVSALTNQPIEVPKGMVTFTFDDGWDTTYAYAYPQMRSYGYKGVVGVITDNVGHKYWNPYGYMSWSQLQTVVNNGWDAISHSVTHPNFDTLNDTQVNYEIQQSQTTLNGNLTGNKGSRFWSQPYDTINANITLKVQQKYDMACFGETTGKNYPNPPMQFDVQRYSVTNATTIAQIKDIVDYAQAYQVWVVFIFHIITPNDTPYDTYVSNSTFASTLAYVHQQNVPVVTFSDVYDSYVSPTTTPTPLPTTTPSATPVPTPTPTPTNQTSQSMTAEQWADYYQWSTNGSALQTYKGMVGIKG